MSLSALELNPGAVHVWFVALDDADKKRRRQLAHLGQSRILAAYLSSEPESIELELGQYGKPRLRGGALHFNLSHSGPVAAVALSRDLEVGIDIQGPHPTAEKPWFAQRICTPRESELLGPNPGPAALLRLWARKEAVIKARGDLSYVSAGELDVSAREVCGDWVCEDLPTAPWNQHHAAVAYPNRRHTGVTVRGVWGSETPTPRS